MASADDYAAWIVKNHALKGTPEFDTVAAAYREAKNDQPAAVQAGNAIMEIPRQIGLTVRHGVEGVAQAVEPFTEPIRAGVNAVSRLVDGPQATQSAGQLATALADTVGLPKPKNANERVVGDMSRMVAGAATLSGGANALAKNATGVTREALSTLGANAGQQAVSAAGAGGAGGAVREAGGGDLAQFGASAAGGVTTALAAQPVMRLAESVKSAVTGMLSPKSSIAEINVTLNNILRQNGIELGQVPPLVKATLADEVRTALRTGGEVNPDVIRRIADYGVVGATPTRGTVTLDPIQITREKNLAKVGANSLDPRLQQLARVQNENNSTLIGNLNEMGGQTAAARDPRATGQRIINTVVGRDDAAREVERDLYNRARDSAGRPIELDRDGFIQSAYNALGESNKGAFLPAEIISLLEQIRAGKAKLLDGTESPVPFNADVIDNLKTVLSNASRSTQDGNVRGAIAQVRNALENTQPRATGRAVGGNQVVDPAKLASAQTQADEAGAEALSAFDRARRYARTLRNWRESSPGVASALDDPNPDRFVQDFIISNSNKSQTAHVEALMHNLRRDPEAAQAVKESVVGYLKSAALNGAQDEVGNFSQSGFNAALKNLGDGKLRIFFSPEEVTRLRALGRVASYEQVQPKGSAVNNSNTASGVAGILDAIASSPIVRSLPLGLNNLVSVPAATISGRIGANTALNANAAATNAKESPRLRQLLAPGALLLSAPSVPGRD